MARYSSAADSYSPDAAVALALDPAGNVYVTGAFGSTTDMEYGTIKYDSNGNQQWVARYNGGGLDGPNAVAVDSSGNVYVTGFSGGVGDNFKDYATIKYDTNGNQLWVARYNGPVNRTDYAYALGLDSAGDVYVAGYSSSSTSTYDYDFATVKYDAGGNQLWVARHRAFQNMNPHLASLAVDSAGNAYVTGSTQGNGGEDYATIKYDTNGNELWVARYNGPVSGIDSASAVKVDDAGNVYVTGSSAGSGSFQDYATIKYDGNGNQLWVARYNAPANGSDAAKAFGLDIAGNVYVTGESPGASLYEFDYATVEYDNAGNQLWVARYNGTGNASDLSKAIAVDSTGNVYVTGSSTGASGTFDFATIKYVQVESVPVAPSELTAQALSSSSIKVSWRDNSDNELGFVVARGDGVTWQPVLVPANSTSFIDTGLKPATTYIYLVAAYNGSGGAWSSTPVVAPWVGCHLRPASSRRWLSPRPRLEYPGATTRITS